MELLLHRYFELKQRKKAIEEELTELRDEIIVQLKEEGLNIIDAGDYSAKLVTQFKKEYDDDKLYKALPDADVWKLISKADSAKIAALLKLKVISEETIEHTYDTKKTDLLIVNKM
ncbi:hypothetical protein [Paenibacillus sp. Marseille-Q4541]|uniref:hypothetical protein n=1 Tax=Paenibacillus sp. Marseille-Q4541 TaxID=2831522 RepID=UPI001BADA0F8|nr:hypothetical protein [Paenibacillus sp. Marseille-Q4541]